MNTTVTGLFQNQRLASLAAIQLLGAGFRREQLRVVGACTPDRHEFIATKTSDTKQAVVFGALAGALTGAALATVFGLVLATVVGGIAISVAGAILGLLIGRATASQVQDEVEHQVESGTVLVSVTTDRQHAPTVLELLAKEGGTSMVSTAASVVPSRDSAGCMAQRL